MNAPSLLTRCQRGDARAWRQLYERFATAVYRWALGFGLDRNGAEEVTQEVFSTALRRISTCQDEHQLPAWFFQITRRHAANARRLAWVRRIVGLGTEPHDGSDLDIAVTPRTELSFDVRQVLRGLPIKYLEVLILHDLDGHTREEVSEMLALPSGTIASRLRTARQLFAEQWGEEGAQ